MQASDPQRAVPAHIQGMNAITRVPKGVPAGGQFAEGRRAESETSLVSTAAPVATLEAPEQLPMAGFVPPRIRDTIWDASYEARRTGRVSDVTMDSLRTCLPATADDEIADGIDRLTATEANDYEEQRAIINDLASADQQRRGIPALDEIDGLPGKLAHPNPYGQGSYVGTRYERSRSVAETARQVRSRLKDLTASGWLPPGLKYSVRTRRGGWSSMLHVTVQGLGDERIYAPHDETAPYSRRYTDEAEELRRRVTDVVDDFNADRSDSMTDYFDVDFYSRVDLETDSDKEFRLDEAAKRAAKRKSA